MAQISKSDVDGLTDISLNCLCRFYGITYRNCTVAEKAARVWSALVKKQGGSVSTTRRVHVPKSVWETASQTKRGDSAEKQACMLRTMETSFFEAPFELPKDYVKQAKLKEKGTSRADVSMVVEESETAHLQSRNSGSEHNTDLEDDEMGDVVDGCGSDGDGDGGWEEPKQEKKKRRAKAKKRSKKAGSTEDTVRESESKQPQSIKDIRNRKLHERTMDVSGTASDPLKLLQNLSPCLEQVCSTLRDVQRELLLPAAKRDSVRDLELADDAASSIATLQAFLASMGQTGSAILFGKHKT